MELDPDQNMNRSSTIQYRKAKTWQIALSQLNGGANMAFYILIGMVSYLANTGYGIAVFATGIIITGTRAFDGITDPIVALLVDKLNTRFGKIRILLLLGWSIESLAVFLLFVWGSNGSNGIVYFILIYLLFIVGYTINSVTGNIIAPVMVNDPKQRPIINVWSTAYAYLFPMIVSTIITMVILPRYNNVYSIDMLATSAVFCVVVALVLNLLSCIGVAEIDAPVHFLGISVKGTQNAVGMKDMLRILKHNRELQMFIVSAASDKLASQTGSQAVVATMFYGILIGNMQLGFMLTLIAMLPSIGFAWIGAKHAGRVGNKEAMVIWTRIAIVMAFLGACFALLSDLRQVTVLWLPTALFFVLMLALNGAKMCVSTATSSMRADIIDYELSFSGKYMPGTVSATYSFIDKSVSALGATLATAGVALIGFREVMPQPVDTPTNSILWVTVLLYYGLPIFGWLCTLTAMKYYTLTQNKMVSIQKAIQEQKDEILFK